MSYVDKIFAIDKNTHLKCLPSVDKFLPPPDPPPPMSTVHVCLAVIYVLRDNTGTRGQTAQQHI